LNVSSSSGEWVVLDNITKIEYERFTEGEIWVMKRDGSGLQKVGSGLYPDLSPDGSKIVYMKPRRGIWIMNRDGSDDHQIVSDTTASYPAWSPDDTLIAYGSKGNVEILNLKNDQIIKVYNNLYFPYWYTGEKFSSICASPNYDGGVTVDISNDKIDTLLFSSSYYLKASPNGDYFIGRDGSWWVCKRDGTNKHYIEP